MDYLDHPFDVATGTSRRPTPTVYAHLRKYSALDEKYVKVTSQTEIQDIQTILENVSTLYVSNEIKYVIGQLLGLYQGKPKTLESDIAGALNIYLKDLASDVTIPTTITGTGQTMLKAEIDVSTAATHTIIAAVALKKHKITTIVFTVAGQTNITLGTGSTDISGPMDFGGSGEPKGMVSNHGAFHLECGVNEAFKLTSSSAVQISGYVLYFDEA